MRTVQVYQYRVRDPVTGRRYLTRYKLTEEEAAQRFPEGQRLDITEETRIYYDPEEAPSSHQLIFGSPKKP